MIASFRVDGKALNPSALLRIDANLNLVHNRGLSAILALTLSAQSGCCSFGVAILKAGPRLVGFVAS
jgi:hypothetical protein